MPTFSSTKLKKLSIGNRIGYTYKLANVQTTGSILRTPFKKITGYLPETTSPGTSEITIVTNKEGTPGSPAALTFAADAESQGFILVVGLL